MRHISDIAFDIAKAWPVPNYAAVPYLNAMRELHSMSDRYYEDSALSVVSYFLANAQTWKGEDARRIKSELKDMIAAHRTAWVEV
jgi:hypothetical protein